MPFRHRGFQFTGEGLVEFLSRLVEQHTIAERRLMSACGQRQSPGVRIPEPCRSFGHLCCCVGANGLSPIQYAVDRGKADAGFTGNITQSGATGQRVPP